MLHLASFLMKINVPKVFSNFHLFVKVKRVSFFDGEKNKKSYKVLKGDRKRKARVSPSKSI